MFSSCRAAQTAVIKGYKSLYHKAGLPFYRKKARCGTALVVFTHSEIFLGQLALKFDVHLKQLLWAISNLCIKFVVSHVHCDVWGICNNIRG